MINKSKNTCSICKKSSFFTIDYKNTWSPLFENKKILVCKTCGFGQIFPKISSDLIIDFYNTVYRSKASPHYVDFTKYIPAPFVFRGRSLSQFLLSLQFLAPKEKYQILDVGAGLGRSFISAKELLQDKFIFYAIEQDTAAIHYYNRFLPGINVCQDFSGFNGTLDLIIMSHSLEHFDITDMPKLFSNIHIALSNDGIVMIEVPHADLRSSYYKEIRFKDTPHLSFFSVDSLKKLVMAHGFDVCFLDTAGMPIESAFQTPMLGKNKYLVKLKKMLSSFWGYNSFAKIRRHWAVSRRMQKETGGRFLRDQNFHYRGNRAVLRCVIKKAVTR
ncbi:class I SAM-dependent methyltransferase [Alphaproteobacteria bacterium]|nr:class I SAM-dependent methyltransferase [Alphaproteobacteria bacterium]